MLAKARKRKLEKNEKFKQFGKFIYLPMNEQKRENLSHVCECTQLGEQRNDFPFVCTEI
jgi:hypothetical protein